MTLSGDDRSERSEPGQIDDAAIEALLTGQVVADELAPLARVVATCREAACQPVRPTGELAARMAAGAFHASAGHRHHVVNGAKRDRQPAAATPRPRRWRVAMIGGLVTAVAKLAGLSVPVKAGAAGGIALAGLGTAGLAGALPDPAQDRFDTIVETVVPGEKPAPASDNPEFGARVTEDARDGEVDGPGISEDARRLREQRRPSDLPDPVPENLGPPSPLPTPEKTASRKPPDPPGQRPDSAPVGPGNQPPASVPTLP